MSKLIPILFSPDMTTGQLYEDYLNNDGPFMDGLKPVESYRSLWASINGPESWNTNPFVWVIEFEKTVKPSTL